VWGGKGKNGIMKDDKVIAGQLSPCIRIFIESLLDGESTTSAARDARGSEKSIDMNKGSRQANRPEVKRTEVEDMAKNISLILHRFKDVRTSILTVIFED